MSALKISETLYLSVEANSKKIRLIVSGANIELACRKESVSALERFLSSDQTQLFKGRLQLHKNQGMLTIVLKGEPVGEVSCALFEEALTNNL